MVVINSFLYFPALSKAHCGKTFARENVTLSVSLVIMIHDAYDADAYADEMNRFPIFV